MLYTAPGGNNHPLPNDTELLGTGQVLSPGAVYNTAALPDYDTAFISISIIFILFKIRRN